MKTRTIRPGAKVFDRDAPLTPEESKRLRADGYEVIGVCINHITMPSADATRAYLDMLHADGWSTFLYQMFPHGMPINAATGRARGELAAKTAADLEWPIDGPLFCDLEATLAPTDEPLPYAKAWVEGYNASARKADAYLSGIGFHFTRAEIDSCGFRFIWQSGALPPAIPTCGYVLKQWQQTTVDGVIVDPDVAQHDALGRLLLVVVGDDAPDIAPTPAVEATPPVDPDLLFRKVIPGEAWLERVRRIAHHIAVLNGGRTDPHGSRALLEPGCRSVPWTCQQTLRAILYHARLRPEDGWPVIDVTGTRLDRGELVETFGGDYGPKIGSGFEDRILPFWGGVKDGSSTYFGGLVGSRVKPWPIAAGMIFCTGTHVGAVLYATETTPGVWEVLTVEGGQADGPVAPATHSWDLGPDGAPVKVTITDGRVDDHCQPFVRTLRYTSDGKIDGMFGVAILGDAPPGLLLPAPSIAPTDTTDSGKPAAPPSSGNAPAVPVEQGSSTATSSRTTSSSTNNEAKPTPPWKAIAVRATAVLSGLGATLLEDVKAFAQAHPWLAFALLAGAVLVVLGLVELVRHRARVAAYFRRSPTDPAVLAAAIAQLKASTDALTHAVSANTPSEK